jgi:hypothetical protein
MKVNKYITPLLAGTAAAVAIAAAPTAFAADHQSCNGSGSGTVCQSPGNVQITAPPPQVQFHPTETRPCRSSTTEQVRGTRVPHPRRWHRTSAARAWRRWSHKSWMRNRLYRVLAG